MLDLTTKLSPHFTLGELCRSSTADRLNIDNVPKVEEVLENLEAVCLAVLEPVREHYGVPFTPNSGFRSLALNRTIGSKDTSQHVLGQAVDFEVPGIDNLALAHWCRQNLEFDQLILEFYKPGQPNSGWVHCSHVRSGNQRGKVGTIVRHHGYLRGLPHKWDPTDLRRYR